MTGSLSFAAMPQVLEDDEAPFVLGFAADPRPCLQTGGAQFRRGSYAYVMQWPLGPVWLRVRVEDLDRGSIMMASAGPLLNDWWPMLREAPEDPARPFLSAGVAKRAVEVSATTGPAIPVNVLPPTDHFAGTTAVFALSGSITDATNLALYHVAAMPVARVALELLGEYRSLAGDVPDVDVPLEGGTLTLADLLDLAAEVAAVLRPRPEAT